MNAPTATRPGVLLAEPDQLTRAGIRQVLEAGGFGVVGEASNGSEALALAQSERPELALVAVELPDGGLEAARRIATQCPQIRLVVLTGKPSGDELVNAVLAGAAGYLGRDTASERLPTILRAVLAGEVALPRRYSQHLLEALRRRDAGRTRLATRLGASLTDREWEVLELLGEDVATGEIARRLGISGVTTRRHISSLVAKLEVPNRAGAVELLRRRSRE